MSTLLAPIASITAAYEVGTETWNVRPVKRVSKSASGWPLPSTFCESAEGTNAILSGVAAEPGPLMTSGFGAGRAAAGDGDGDATTEGAAAAGEGAVVAAGPATGAAAAGDGDAAAAAGEAAAAVVGLGASVGLAGAAVGGGALGAQAASRAVAPLSSTALRRKLRRQRAWTPVDGDRRSSITGHSSWCWGRRPTSVERRGHSRRWSLDWQHGMCTARPILNGTSRRRTPSCKRPKLGFVSRRAGGTGATATIRGAGR